MVDYSKNPIIRNIQLRLWQRNKNWLAVFTGETGSGKSWSAISLAEQIDPTFDISRVTFRVKDLLHLINSGELKKGSVAVLDESGVSFSNRRWFTQENMQLNFLLQVIRHKNFAIIFCLPSFMQMDKGGRTLLHAYIRTRGIDPRKRTCRCQFKEMQWNDIEGKYYYHFPRIRDAKTGMIRRITFVDIHEPSDKIKGPYETKKTEFTTWLSNKAEKKLDEMEADVGKVKEHKVKKIDLIMEAIKKNPDMDDFEIARMCHTSKTYVEQVRKIMI